MFDCMRNRKLRSHLVNTVSFYSSQIMDMPVCNTCGKSFKDRNCTKCSLCLTKVHLECSYLNYVDSQYAKFSNKTWHCYNYSKVPIYNNKYCLMRDSIVIVIQINHA